jgi:hypothetical protein
MPDSTAAQEARCPRGLEASSLAWPFRWPFGNSKLEKHLSRQVFCGLVRLIGLVRPQVQQVQDIIASAAGTETLAEALKASQPNPRPAAEKPKDPATP